MDERLLTIFRGEAEERLDRMVQTLLTVEAGAGDEESVRELFRHAHSLKGTAGMVGLKGIGQIAAAVEDVLSAARHDGELEPAMAGPLLAVTDAIREAMAGQPIDPDEVVAALGAAAGRTEDGSQAGEPREVEGRDPPPEPPAPPAPPEPSRDPAPRELVPAPPAPVAAAVPSVRPAGIAHPAGRTLRVAADRVDELLDATGNVVNGIRRFRHVLGDEADSRIRDEVEGGEAMIMGVQQAVLDLRTLPLASIVGPFSRAVRDIAAAEGKEVSLELIGVDASFDRAILDALPDLIVHLLRNAVSHGIEPPAEREAAGKPRAGTIVLRAEPQGSEVTVTIADDGRGVASQLRERASSPVELAELLSTPGLSTAETVGTLSGRGVGLDAVRRDVEALGGAMLATTVPGEGTEFVLRLPSTLAVIGTLMVEREGRVFGIGLSALEEVVELERIVRLGDTVAVDVRGEAIQLADLASLLGMRVSTPASGPALIVSALNRRIAVRVDRLVGEQEGLVKSLGQLLAGVRGYIGATFLSTGGLALILDARHLVRVAPSVVAAGPEDPLDRVAPAAADGAPRVLVVDDQFTVRELQRTILSGAGYEVLTARDGREALELLEREPDVRLVLTDIEMPVLDGFGLLVALRDDERFASLPVVVVSSRGGDDDRRRGAEAGADAYVDKAQFDQRTLLETVERLVVR